MSVQHRSGLFSAHVALNMSGKSRKLVDMDKKDAKVAADMINHQLSVISGHYQGGRPIQRAQQTQDPFTILDNRLAAGQISIEEYKSTKRTLQGTSQSDENTCPSCGSIVSKQTIYCTECGFNVK